jgi:uncharacterized protein (TIGR00369 family)
MDRRRSDDGGGRIRDSFERQGLMRTLGATLDEVEDGRTAIRLPRSDTLTQQHGYLHAGALIAITDSACGYAALTKAPPAHEVLTAELKVNLLAPAAGQAVIARGRVVRAGRTLTVCQGDCFDADDPSKHLLTMLATMVLIAA